MPARSASGGLVRQTSRLGKALAAGMNLAVQAPLVREDA